MRVPYSDFFQSIGNVLSPFPISYELCIKLSFENSNVSFQPPSEPIQQQCPQGYRRCCYDPQDTRTLNDLGLCLPADGITQRVPWQQGCRENIRRTNGKQCGTRSFKPLFNLEKGQASPEEFPWSCIMLDGNNKFLGSCAIVPEQTDNDISRGTRRVITAAHKLKLQKSEWVIEKEKKLSEKTRKLIEQRGEKDRWNEGN